MICDLCLEEKTEDEFYYEFNGQRRSACIECYKAYRERYRTRLKEIESLIKGNVKNIKLGKTYSIKSRNIRKNNPTFTGKAIRIYPRFTLFESPYGYKECYSHTDFVEDYIIK